MNTYSSIQEFHNWLHAKCNPLGESCSILLHDNGAVVDDGLVEKIAEYLNEYDEEGEGRWLAATETLVRAIAEDAFLRQLIGLEYELLNEKADCSAIFARAFDAMSRRGHIIGRPPVSDYLLQSNGQHFDVGIGDTEPRLCHMILNPDKISSEHIAPIIGDVFLEWLHGRYGTELSA